jgi:hypothetical protein
MTATLEWGGHLPGISGARDELRWMLSNSRAPKLRTRRQFAEQELILPEGPFKDRRFKVARQPFTGLWLDACDGNLDFQPSTRFRRIITTGPSQSGKSWQGTVVPVTYHLFEIGETVGFALPDMDMADDKWRKDILPAIERTRYRELLPARGEGSQGGKVKNMVLFKNGAALKFFSAGGGDKSRAGFACRVLVITEANAFGGSAEASNESTKLEQLLARLLSFGDQSLVYMECTVEIESDVIWSHYTAGTASRIACPCPHCRAFVTPEREHLVGWSDAASGDDAKLTTSFQCPACENPIDDTQRRAMNERAVLLHKGQAIEVENARAKSHRLRIVGDAPKTDMLGFRWNAFNNLFLTAGQLGQFEWEGKNAVDEDAHERKQHQFIWCRPYQAAGDEQQTLDANALMGRMGPWERGIVPADTFCLTSGCDLRKRQLHYKVIAWTADGRAHVVDYRWLPVAGDELDAAVAILQALRAWRDQVIMPGFTIDGTSTKWVPDQCWVDARYQGDNKGDAAVFRFILESERERFRPCLGFGVGNFRAERYSQPRATSKTILAIGERYHLQADPVHRLAVVHIDSDHWKGFFQDRLLAPLRAEGSQTLLPACLTLYRTPDRKEHAGIAKHWSAERRVTEYVPGKGHVTRFEQLRRTNHFLDAGMLASPAAHYCGVRLVKTTPRPSPEHRPPTPSSALSLPDGRPYFVLDRH